MIANHHELLASGELREQVQKCLKDLDGGGPAAQRFSDALSRLLKEAEESKKRQEATKLNIMCLEKELAGKKEKLRKITEDNNKLRSDVEKQERDNKAKLEILQSLKGANDAKQQEVCLPCH